MIKVVTFLFGLLIYSASFGCGVQSGSTNLSNSAYYTPDLSGLAGHLNACCPGSVLLGYVVGTAGAWSTPVYFDYIDTIGESKADICPCLSSYSVASGGTDVSSGLRGFYNCANVNGGSDTGCNAANTYDCYSLSSLSSAMGSASISVVVCHRACLPDTTFQVMESCDAFKHTLDSLTGRNNAVGRGAHDSTYSVDGGTVTICVQGNKSLPGSCSGNGIDTGSSPLINGNTQNGKQVFDSSLNTVKGSVDTSHTGLTNSNYDWGVGQLSRVIDSNGLVESSLLNSLLGVNRSISNGAGSSSGGVVSDTNGNGIDWSNPGAADTSSLGGWGDTANLGSLKDSASVYLSIKARIDSSAKIDSGDTNIVGPDSSRVSQFFSAFATDWGDTSACDCDSTLFPITFLGSVHYVNLCVFDIGQYTKWVFGLLAAFGLFLFYRRTVFKLLMHLYKFMP